MQTNDLPQSTHSTRRTAALELLARTGMRRSSYEPALLRLLWRLNLNVPPPHFIRFGSVALFSGIYFAIAIGLIQWIFEQIGWASADMPFAKRAMISAIAGVFYGVFMAAYYAYGRKKHRLPSWDELSPRESEQNGRS